MPNLSLTCFVGLQEYRERADDIYNMAVGEFTKTHPTFIPTSVSLCEHALFSFDAKNGLPRWWKRYR